MFKNLIVIICICCLSSVFILIPTSHIGAERERTDWWTLKKHWDRCRTKDHPEDLEYMSRVQQYDYIVPHKTPIKEIAVLPASLGDKESFTAIATFEKEVLFKKEEIEKEFLKEPKNWSIKSSSRDSFGKLKEAKLYDKYQRFVDEFKNYRSIDKDILLEMGNVLGVDTVLFTLSSHTRSGITYWPINEPEEVEVYFLDVFLFSVKEGNIIWEFGKEIKSTERFNAPQWRGFYKEAFKSMPIE